MKMRSRCINWPGSTNGRGYGLILLPKTNKGKIAHRIIYEGVYGPQGELVIDHICRNKLCVNIKHLRAITNKENVLCGIGTSAENSRKKFCIKGHEFRFRKDGWRECPTCKLDWQKRNRDKRMKP